jgi:hypothetical protein
LIQFKRTGSTKVSDDQEAARRRAEEAYRLNQQSQAATEQSIRDADTRNAYNAELARQQQADNR